MASSSYSICVSTSKPTTSLTAGGGGGSMILLCPRTGSVLSSFRTARGAETAGSKSTIGMSHLSAFPNTYSSSGSSTLILSYGAGQRKDDTYGMLLSLRRAPLPPLLHWKCRLPESSLSAGLVVSNCGNYVVGGGTSGVCYVWSALGGSLLRTVRAHYRSVTALAWSACGHYLVTGGGDGVVHTFSLMDLVDLETPDGKTVVPLRTWSYHHLPVTALKALPGDRMATASDDCKVSIIELFSDVVVMTVEVPHSIRALDFSDGRLFAGAIQGSVYTIDLEVYAMHQTSQLGVVVKRPHVDQTNEDQVFGDNDDTSQSYKSELHGHSNPISALAVIKGDSSDLLVSGDEGGTLRVWDLESRSCIRIMEPWSQSAQQTTSIVSSTEKATPSSAAGHPVTAILVVARGDDITDQQQSTLGDFGSSQELKKGLYGVVNLVTPLQKFKQTVEETEESSVIWTPVPFLTPISGDASKKLRDKSLRAGFEVMNAKRRKMPSLQEEKMSMASEITNANGLTKSRTDEQEEDEVRVDTGSATQLEEQKQEMVRLKAELEEAKSTIQRWEKVNNKLVAKLNQASSAQEH